MNAEECVRLAVLHFLSTNNFPGFNVYFLHFVLTLFDDLWISLCMFLSICVPSFFCIVFIQFSSGSSPSSFHSRLNFNRGYTTTAWYLFGAKTATVWRSLTIKHQLPEDDLFSLNISLSLLMRLVDKGGNGRVLPPLVIFVSLSLFLLSKNLIDCLIFHNSLPYLYNVP